MEEDYYSILGLTEEDKKLGEKEFVKKLKKSYRELCKQWHPDKHTTDTEDKKKEAEDKFKKISEAYDTLSDSSKRAQYDNRGKINDNPFGDGFDPFANMDPFGRGQAYQRKGEDIRTDVNVTLQEVFNGSEKTIRYYKKESCHYCGGTGAKDGKKETCLHCGGYGRIRMTRQFGNGGYAVSETTCPYCGGKGYTYKESCPHCHGSGFENVECTKKITIPSGIINNSRIVLRGEGGSVSGGVNGDLYVVLHILPDDGFTLLDDGVTLYTKFRLNLKESICGCGKDIRCIDGTLIKINIPELTKPGKRFKVGGKGMKIAGTSQRGNMIVEVEYELPDKLTEKQKKLLEEFYE